MSNDKNINHKAIHQSVKTDPKLTQILELADDDIPTAILIAFCDLKVKLKYGRWNKTQKENTYM